jgi:outer membrane protein OmpA-like peptidoglycan-associated protein
MFPTGKAELTKKFQDNLRDFFPRYLKIITSEKFAPSIKEILLEGHTSNDYAGVDYQYVSLNVDIEVKKYLSNMDLAQNRTNNTNKFLYSIPETRPYHPLMLKILHLHDVSSSYPVIKSNGEIDPDLSRRVEFKIITNADKKMEEIAATLRNLEKVSEK